MPNEAEKIAGFKKSYREAAAPILDLLREIVACGYSCDLTLGLTHDGKDNLDLKIFKRVEI